MPTKVILKKVRGSYVYLTAPRKNKDGTLGKYSIQTLIPKDHPQIKELRGAIEEAAKKQFGDKVKLKTLKMPLRDGDGDSEEKEGEEYRGMYFMNVNGGKKPGIVNRFCKPASEDDLEELCFSGAYYHVSINFYGFDVDGNKGVAAGLSNVMLRSEGDRLDGSVKASAEFGDYAEESSEESGDEDTVW